LYWSLFATSDLKPPLLPEAKNMISAADVSAREHKYEDDGDSITDRSRA
jgi:hypothetical protein